MKSSTMLIWRVRSISEAGPFQRISTPISCPALTAPACTDCQKMCACPLGITAMTRLWSRLQEMAANAHSDTVRASGIFILDVFSGLPLYQISNTLGGTREIREHVPVHAIRIRGAV